VGIVFEGKMYYYISKECYYSQEIYVIDEKTGEGQRGRYGTKKALDDCFVMDKLCPV
jgi:hypothetical protein